MTTLKTLIFTIMLSVSFVTEAKEHTVGAYTVWGSYSAGGFTWKNIVVPASTKRNELITIAKRLKSTYPNTRIHIFNDDTKIKQYVQRDIYFSAPDRSKVKKVEFPGAWVDKHFLGNINDRSTESMETGQWQLVTPYGEPIDPL